MYIKCTYQTFMYMVKFPRLTLCLDSASSNNLNNTSKPIIIPINVYYCHFVILQHIKGEEFTPLNFAHPSRTSHMSLCMSPLH